MISKRKAVAELRKLISLLKHSDHSQELESFLRSSPFLSTIYSELVSRLDEFGSVDDHFLRAVLDDAEYRLTVLTKGPKERYRLKRMLRRLEEKEKKAPFDYNLRKEIYSVVDYIDILEDEEERAITEIFR